MTSMCHPILNGYCWLSRNWCARIVSLAWIVFSGMVSGRANQITTAPNFGPFHVEAGEYTMLPDAGVAALLEAYSPFTMNYGHEGTFQTFCAERGEGIIPNTTYDVTMNRTTLFTGVELTVGAAFLYQQFATGQLSYNFANSPTDSRTTGAFHSAYYLQHAIWDYMGGYNEVGNPYQQLVNGLFANPFAPDNGAHSVSILNLWVPGQPHDPQHSYQDVLIYNPVPEPSVTALLPLAALIRHCRRKT